MASTTKAPFADRYSLMTETPVSRLILKLGFPTTVSMLVTNIYNMADTYFVSTLGTSASGAVGIVFGLMAILQAFGFMYGHGAGSIISRKLGAKDEETASRIASTSFFCAIATGALIGAFGLIFTNPLLRLLGSTDTILPYARSYGVWILIAAPLMTSSFVMNNILRYEGRASFAMVGLTTGGILNIFGDWLLITKFNMGVAGAGISTAVSQTVSFLILLSMFLRRKTQSRLSIKYISKSFKDYTNIISTGFPSLTRQGLSSISTMLLNGCAGAYGDAAIAGMTIVGRICFFIFAVGLGIGQGFQPVSAFNYGAKKYSRVKKGYFFTLFMGEALLGALAVVGFFIGDPIITVFRDDPEVLKVASLALKAQLIALFFQPLCICSNMLFQSIGKNAQASVLSAMRSGVTFIPILLILNKTLGILGVQLAQPAADVVTFFITIPFIVIFFKNYPKDGE